MHFLPFGTVVTVAEVGEDVLFMIVDWSCKDEDETDWDYVSVPETLGWTWLGDEEKSNSEDYTDAVFFNHSDIEKIYFFGPPSKRLCELEQEVYGKAREEGLPIARYYDNTGAKELNVSLDARTRNISHSYKNEGTQERGYLPLGTICVIAEIKKDATESELYEVMIVGIKPEYLESEYDLPKAVDYRVMPASYGYLSTDCPLCIRADEIIEVSSLGYVNADVQNTLVILREEIG